MSATEHDAPPEIAILARLLANGPRPLPTRIASYIIDLGFSQDEKRRIHDLATRNQEGVLSTAEKDELLAYSKAGTLLSILKSKARRVLRPIASGAY